MSLLEKIKNNNEDFEWYPTTDAMISVIASKLREIFEGRFSMLDIGAGDGRVLRQISEQHQREEYSRFYGGISEKFAIEKSPTLLQSLPDDVIVIGTDFHLQTLIDKTVDVVFCNPPYSEFEEWSYRIIKEANCKHLFLIIPQRWQENKAINSVLEQRKASFEIIFSGDFEDAERKARAKVDIIHVSFVSKNNHDNWKENKEVDPFDIWFNETFKINQTVEIKEEPSTTSSYTPVKGRNMIERMVEIYDNRLLELVNNYKAIGKLDYSLLSELGVSADNIKKAIKEKVAGLKKFYWEGLFSNLEGVTSRLTSRTRREMLERLNKNIGVDFNKDNIYAVVFWALKNANKYIDQQLLTLYKEISSEENVSKYKSNVHMTKDTWRYCNRDSASHYKLEYRIVLSKYEPIRSYGKGYLSDAMENLLRDIFTVANNLGFKVQDKIKETVWTYGQEETFNLDSGEIFFKIRIYKNGNSHIKFNQKFIKALNIEAGRLNNWIKSAKDVEEEMNIPAEEAEKFLFSNLQIKTSPLLTTGE